MVLVLVLLGGCSGDDGGADDAGGWLDQWEGELVEHEGQPVKVDDEAGMIYVEDCGLARELNDPGGPYGPADGEPGYGFVCDE